LRKMGNGSVYSGELPTGCVHCQEGSKMVLLVSGHCGESCFYCPLSHEKKGHDTIYADETAVTHDEEIIREAERPASPVAIHCCATSAPCTCCVS